jgi:periplasmic protein TonB
MATVIEMPEPQVLDQRDSADGCACQPRIAPQSTPPPPLLATHLLFSDSLLESSSSERRRRGLATTLSIIFQCTVITGLLIMPSMFTEALPTQQLLTFLLAPPPPLPPPAAAPVAKVVETDMVNDGQLRTPTRIPRKVEMIREEEAPPPAMAGAVVGGVPGGIPGGQLGGVIGGIISSGSNSTALVPKLEPVKRVRVSQGITRGMVISKIEPTYPKIALAARITGVVLLKAVISKEGDIKELQVVSGHPLLVPAAIEAVKRWRYRPYLLNGEPVEVETNITVTFQIAS